MVLQIGNTQITAETILPLLTSTRLAPTLIRELIIEQAIDAESADSDRKLRLQHFKEQRWGNQTQSYFLKRKRSLDRLVYSMIRTRNAELAQELFFRLQDDEQRFAEIAKTYSEGAEANTNGIVGPVIVDSLHPAIATLLTSSKPGQVHRPISLQGMWVILKLERSLPAEFTPQTQQRLLDELFELWLRTEVQHWLVENGLLSSTEQSAPVLT